MNSSIAPTTPQWFDIKGGKRCGLKIQHPATYPEKLVERLLLQYTKEQDLIFDPFCGSGSTLVSCLENNRCGIGVELSKDYAEIAQKRVLTTSVTSNKDAWAWVIHSEIGNFQKIKLPEFDAVITSPPYYNVLADPSKPRQQERQSKGLKTSYTNCADDLGAISNYECFLQALVDILVATKTKMKSGATLSIVLKNVKKEGVTYPLAFDLYERLSDHFTPLPEQIWVQDNIKLFPYAMFTKSWVSNVCHSYVLSLKNNQ